MPQPARPNSSGAPLDLARYGWGEDLRTAFAEHRRAGLTPARVVRVDGGLCDTITAHGPVRADAPAVPRADPLLSPCTGDWAALRGGSHPRLVAVLPRRSAIVRSSAARSSHGQVLAANVDTVVITVSLAAAVNAGRVERLLTLAWESGARPVVVLTKADLAGDPAAVRAEVEALAPGADVLAVSAATGAGMDVLAALLTGTTVLLGPSGTGKSTLGNALLGEPVLATGKVREQDGKGRHTTVRRELVPLPRGGVLIDTPGLRGIGLFDAAGGLEQTFAEIERLARDCRFGDCAHETEPGCAVRAAIDAGALTVRRLDSYRKLQRENDWTAARSDARRRAELRAERAERSKAFAGHLRATYAFRDRQA
jgi:ribosome biogenesis GTPase